MCVNFFSGFFFPDNMLVLILWRFWTADKLSTFDQPTALMQFVLQVRFRDFSSFTPSIQIVFVFK